jgi:DNA-binding transcriptional MerR regulator
MSEIERTVGQVARMARVSVRTLHHYHEIGLLVPTGRSEAGYRLYGPEDVERLHAVLLLRELGLPLEEIRSALGQPTEARLDALLAHRERLVERAARLESALRAVYAHIARLKEGTPMNTDMMMKNFDEFQDPEHAAEARERWGDTDAWKESQRRTKSYRPKQWAEMKGEAERIESAWASHLDAGLSPEDPRAVAVAEEARLHINRWFYPCGVEMHVALAEMYEADPRFRAHYEGRREGLVAFVAASIRANAARARS